MKLTKTFVEDIRELIRTARVSVARGVDLVQVYTNFEIGRRIVEEEQRGKGRAEYGAEIIRSLAERLTGEFGKGFSKRNLELMRRFFLLYSDHQSPIAQSPIAQLESTKKLQSSIAKSKRSVKAQAAFGKMDDSTRPAPPLFSLGWTHYIFLLGVKNSDERNFYEIEATEQSWTVRELKRQYDSSLYERLALSRDKRGIRKLAKEGQAIAKPEDLLKEPLVLEFLGLEERNRYSESDLESAIIGQIENFLLELGKGFLFEARQKRFSFDEEHFFIDLVFYNRLLRCYVLVDLKIGKLGHQDLGQMQMYVNYFDRCVKTEEENATVGIILCKKKHDALVEITLPKDANIHAKEYRLYLPSKEELQRKLIEWAGEEDIGSTKKGRQKVQKTR